MVNTGRWKKIEGKLLFGMPTSCFQKPDLQGYTLRRQKGGLTEEINCDDGGVLQCSGFQLF